MTATPGQRAYEAMHASRMKRAGIEDPDYAAWEALDLMTGEGGLRREDMEAAAQAVLNDAFPGLREQLRLARAAREQVRAALAVSNADLGREREQVRLAGQDRNQLRKAVLGEISGNDPDRIHWYVYVLMDPDGNLCTGTNAVGPESVRAALARAAEEWPA